MNGKSLIYGLFDPRDGLLRYIGQTVSSLKERLRGHCKDKRFNHRTCWITCLKRLGLKPIIKPMVECPIEQACDEEAAMIASVRSTGALLLNRTDGDEYPMSSAIRVKLSEKHRGKKMSPEARAKMSAWQIGRKQTPEHIASRIAGRIRAGYRHSAETREKMSATQKGRKLSPERCAQMAAQRRGTKHSLETRRKMSQSHMARLARLREPQVAETKEKVNG